MKKEDLNTDEFKKRKHKVRRVDKFLKLLQEFKPEKNTNYTDENEEESILITIVNGRVKK